MPSIISDAAVGCSRDKLQFGRYVDPLLSLFSDEFAETPFTVGIFGSWGSGKSSLLKMLNERLENDPYKGRFICVNFNPWIHRGEENMLIPLLHTLRDELNESKWEKFKGSAEKIGNVLVRLAGDAILKHFTADAVSLEDIEKIEEKYDKQRGRVTSEMRKLHKTLQHEVTTIHNDRNTRLIFFIDDLDRCEPDEIIDLLESVKLFFDLEHAFIVLAIDKEVIDRGVEIRYSKFRFARDRKLSLGAEYLEKMVQLPLHLYPPSTAQVGQFMDDFGPADDVKKLLPLLNQIIVPNPRKIKRVLNILEVTTQIAGATPGVASLDPGLLARLAVLRVQGGDLYGEILRLPELLIGLEGCYAAKQLYRLEADDDWKDFGVNRARVQDLCKTYYLSQPWLQPLFRDAGFAKAKPQLGQYLSMIGA